MEQSDKTTTDGGGPDLMEYFHLLWSWAWLIVLTSALAGAITFLISTRQPPTYEASAWLLVSAPSTISGVDPTTGTNSMQTLTSTYSQMLTDPSVLAGVIQQLNLRTTPEELAQSISVEAPPNTQLLQITAEDSNPQRAAEIANAMARVFAARVQDLRSRRYASIRDGLVAQVSDMEQQITSTSSQIAAMEQELSATGARNAAVIGTQLAASATQTLTAIEPQRGAAATQTVIAVERQLAVAATQTTVAVPATVEPAALIQLQERLTQYRTLYSNLVLSYEQVRLAEEQASSNVVISETARVNAVPVRPRPLQSTLLALVAGTMLAVGVALVSEKLDDTVRNPDEIRSKFQLSILGIIAWQKTQEDEPIVLAEPRSPGAEAFRSLRTNLTYAAVDAPLRRILVTSPMAQDGKTTVASNLAMLLSQTERRVLLLDADLRRPQTHHRFGLQNRAGLSDLFVCPLDEIDSFINAIHPTKLAVITSGALPPNPAELLMSHTMRKILDRLNHQFDLIVIDTPPLLTVTDAAALAPATDGVILVVRPGETKLGALKQALEQLRAVGARVLGVVLNDVNPSSRRYGRYYRRYDPKYRYSPHGGSPVLRRLRGSLSHMHAPNVAAEPEPTASRQGTRTEK